MKASRTPGYANGQTAVTDEERHRMIEEAAYFIAERRGFAPGDPHADWTEAETQVDRLLMAVPNAPLTAASKKAFKEQLEAQLRAWDDAIEQLKAKAATAKTGLRTEYDEQLHLIAGKRAELEAKLRNFGTRGKGSWEDLKAGTEHAWADFRAAIERASSRFK